MEDTALEVQGGLGGVDNSTVGDLELVWSRERDLSEQGTPGRMERVGQEPHSTGRGLQMEA